MYIYENIDNNDNLIIIKIILNMNSEFLFIY